MRDSSSPSHSVQSSVSVLDRQGNFVPQRVEAVAISSLEAERSTWQNAGFSESVIRTALASTRPSSRSVYDSRWKAFVSWCSERSFNPVSTVLTNVLDFLQHLVPSRSVNTIKGYVTAISKRHVQVDSFEVGSHPFIKKWVKGLSQTQGVPRLIIIFRLGILSGCMVDLKIPFHGCMVDLRC